MPDLSKWWDDLPDDQQREAKGLYKPKHLSQQLVRSLKDAGGLPADYKVGDEIPEDTDVFIFLKARH